MAYEATDEEIKMIEEGDIVALLKSEMRKQGFTTYVDVDGIEKPL